MKPSLHVAVLFFITGIIIFVACKKEYSCEGCADNHKNKPPIAIAGPDQVITLPTDSVSLDGRSSSDPDGTISSYLWTKISGPASFNINNRATAATIVKNLVAGVYQFELTVTDNGSLLAKDTLQVLVDDPAVNQPPVANAGPDKTITLPTNTVNLDGSGSTDPENNITSYAWTKISGPLTFSISNENAVQTQVTNLVQGIYQFELKVTDAGGLYSRDTLQVTVNAAINTNCDISNRPVINAQLVPFGFLSERRSGMSVGAAGNKILFAGGFNENDASSRVDIYDMVTQTWSTAELSAPRWDMAVATSGSKIFFGGGSSDDLHDDYYSNVDIYDASTNTWSVAHLSEARASIAAAAVGNKVFFAGGYNSASTVYDPSSKIDIYDISTNNWSVATLSEARNELTATTAGNKIYFAGGNTSYTNTPSATITYPSNKIDIYDNATNTWSVSTLNQPGSGMTAIIVGDNIYWAGGLTQSGWVQGGNTQAGWTNSVEIRNVNNATSSAGCLFHPNYFASTQSGAVSKDNKIVFFLGWRDIDVAPNIREPKFDIYDITSGTWLIGSLNQHIGRASIISVNNIIYVAGGEYYSGGGWQFIDKVWKLEF